MLVVVAEMIVNLHIFAAVHRSTVPSTYP